MGGIAHARTYTTRKTDKNTLGYHGGGGEKDHSATGGGGDTSLRTHTLIMDMHSTTWFWPITVLEKLAMRPS